MKHPYSVYELTDAEKAELIEKVSQDITFEAEADLFETEDTELFDNEMYLDDTEEVA
jgi:hypothetical protein